MKRDHRLRRLSEDHHHALVLARRARQAAADNGSPPETWREVVLKFAEELEPHFEIEERLILPALDAKLDGALIARTLDEHDRLRRLVRDEEGPLARRLADFGSLLTEHVRFEERVLFPVVEQRLPSDVLDAIGEACANAFPARSRGRRDG